MTVLHAAARLLFGWLFVSAGVDVLRHPGRRAQAAAPFLAQTRKALPQLPADDVTLVRANAAVQLVAGAALATGRAPRLSALALAGSLVPTTIAGHAFWKADESARATQKIQFQKNAAIVGGLLFAATARKKRS